jgi:glyoxylate utilization-related uncharacterized protein
VSRPTRVSLDEVKSVPLGHGNGGRVTRLVTRALGADMLTGIFSLEPGAVAKFALGSPADAGCYLPQETYFVLAGELRVSWEGGELTAGRHDAIYFPPGGEYEVSACPPEIAQVVYTLIPAPP